MTLLEKKTQGAPHRGGAGSWQSGAGWNNPGPGRRTAVSGRRPQANEARGGAARPGCCFPRCAHGGRARTAAGDPSEEMSQRNRREGEAICRANPDRYNGPHHRTCTGIYACGRPGLGRPTRSGSKGISQERLENRPRKVGTPKKNCDLPTGDPASRTEPTEAPDQGARRP
jgi:hypothetical protein